MAIDRKYGKVTTEFGNIGENEPVVVFRAQDMLLPAVLEWYAAFAARTGSPSRHVHIVMNTRQAVLDWQAANGCRIPTSESSRGRLAE